MENSILNQMPSEALWALVSFVLGLFIKYLFNVLVTPKIKILEEILPDIKTKKPYIKVTNTSFAKWNKAYDLHFHLTYYYTDGNKYKPFHTGVIDDGIIKPNTSEKYSISLKQKVKYNLDNTDYKINVILIYRNRFSTYSIVEQECFPNTNAIKSSVKK